jgi:4-aminobutyrate aminotransferase-like enzyme/Ser/Thr protein kinase RdoA (MazF antagonist)
MVTCPDMSAMTVVVQHAPRLSAPEAERLAVERYGIHGAAVELPSERDQNFRVTSADLSSVVLKVSNATERDEILDFQNRAIEHLAARDPGLALPRVLVDREGRTVGRTPHGGREHLVRALSWVPGRLLSQARPHTRELLASLGGTLARMDRAFAGFTHPAMNRSFAWDLGATAWIGGELDRLADRERRALLERVLDRFESHARPRLAGLRRQVVHNDWNDNNVLVTEALTAPARVVGAVDFGDILESWTVADLAVACAYALLGKPDPVGAAAAIAGGYHELLPLEEDELDVLPDLVRARLAISVTMAACQAEQSPDNDYLRVSERQAWDLLARLDAVSPAWMLASLRTACGRPATRTSQAVREWLTSRRGSFAAIVDEPLGGDAAVVVDLSVGSLAIANPALVETLPAFCAMVDDTIARQGGRAGIGRYDEARLVYVSDLFRHVSNWEPENRTVHLGLDIFLPAGSPVRAPLAGTVRNARNNAGAGDYGPTLILEHEVEPGLRFFTLYGHLSLDSLAGRRTGQPVQAGELLGRLGTSEVNGGWPPHLHLQVMTDLLDRSGDFPGVAAPSERAIWLDLCPDPNPLVGIPDERIPAVSPSTEALLALRRRHVGPNLSLSYRRPLAMVRGWMQFLFDADGRRYLDGVNNVPHVGHGHPRVVAAAARQLAVLNTNTRYLHPALSSYAARLASLLPDPLDVCYIVCSGSEANELALRLARAWTGHEGVVVLDGAYHGNTSSLVDISPYKFSGPGGGGPPPHVRVAAMPDTYRGPYRRDDPLAGARYGASVAGAVSEIQSRGRGVAAFFCESLLSCGGQIVLPPGYLEHAYAAVRAAGGVTVADEVQVGFGRVGTHLWGFETQGVVPDIVTLGKPIGNGYPLAAVVTRRDIAEAFDNGMEYFNTFGGGQAACAAGHAVLDVMRDEGLQQRALEVGARLRDGLAALASRFPIVGDVRGLGLFLGVELVEDRERLVPAARQADYVVNRARERGVLLSTDGPLHNVIKIKPPLQFDAPDADRAVEVLADILQEDGARS